MLPAVFIDAEVFIWNNGTFESINLSTAFTIALSHVQQIKLPSSSLHPPGNIVGVRSTSHNSNLLKNASQWFQMNFNCSAFVLISLNRSGLLCQVLSLILDCLRTDGNARSDGKRGTLKKLLRRFMIPFLATAWFWLRWSLQFIITNKKVTRGRRMEFMLRKERERAICISQHYSN